MRRTCEYFVARFAPDDWAGSPAFDYVCFECNPLLGAIRESRTRYRFSDFAPRDKREFKNARHCA